MLLKTDLTRTYGVVLCDVALHVCVFFHVYDVQSSEVKQFYQTLFQSSEVILVIIAFGREYDGQSLLMIDFRWLSLGYQAAIDATAPVHS